MCLPCLPQNSRLIVVDAKERTKQLLYKCNVVNPNYSPENNARLVLFNNNYYPLTSLPAWYGQNCYCIECEVRYTSKQTCKPDRTCCKCSEKTVNPSPHIPDVAKGVLALFVIVPVSEIICQTVCVTIQRHVTYAGQCLNTYAIYPIAVIVLNLSNQITSVLLCLKSDPMSSHGNMCYTTFSVLKTPLTLKQSDPPTKLIIVLL